MMNLLFELCEELGALITGGVESFAHWLEEIARKILVKTADKIYKHYNKPAEIDVGKRIIVRGVTMVICEISYGVNEGAIASGHVSFIEEGAHKEVCSKITKFYVSKGGTK